jgi:intracellular multiplication protein IcmP
MFLFLLLIFWGGGYLVWKGFRPQITEGVVAVRSAEMKLASLWWDDEDIIRVPLPASTDDEGPLKAKLGDNERLEWHETKFGAWRKFAQNATRDQVQAEHLKVMTYVALWPLRWLIVAILGAMFFWTMWNGPTSKFHRVLGLEGLIRDQAKTFKVIQPFVAFNPSSVTTRPIGAPVPAELPPFAEALSPEEWIAINEIPMMNGLPDAQAAEEAFANQLGPRWKGASALPTELQILLACFCLKASRKRNESDEMLGRLSACWDYKGGLKLSRDRALGREARKILRDKKLSERTLSNCNRHAYVSTALMRALNTAREEGGVLAPATFVWLRAHDRALWYPLNNLGRHAYHIEATGACAHYRAEKQVNRPIPRPRVLDAVDGLMDHMKNPILARPIPPVEGSRKSKAA